MESHDPSEASLVYHQHRFTLDKALSPECRIIKKSSPTQPPPVGPKASLMTAESQPRTVNLLTVKAVVWTHVYDEAYYQL